MRKPFKSHKKKKIWLRRLRKINRSITKRKSKKYSEKRRLNFTVKPIAAWAGIRKNFVSNHYAPRAYDSYPIRISVPDEIGLEKNLEHFLDFAESFIGQEPQELNLDMTKCNFIWPSAITLLCSLKQWFDLTRRGNNIYPRVASSRSSSESVNSYLDHCGFYDYVSRPKDATKIKFDDKQVVKIVKERSATNIVSRIKNVKSLLRQYSLLTEEQLEDFGDSVLPEVFLNVTEHGVNYSYAGWYTLTQYRPTTGIITLCVADNGIGIKNSLLTGPQRDSLISKFPHHEANDGDIITEALKENISGAWKASNKTEGLIFKSYERGQRRGLGLTRIKDCCTRINIPMTIASGAGAIQIANNNQLVYNRENKVFAGTMYHFLIPAKKHGDVSE